MHLITTRPLPLVPLMPFNRHSGLGWHAAFSYGVSVDAFRLGHAQHFLDFHDLHTFLKATGLVLCTMSLVWICLFPHMMRLGYGCILLKVSTGGQGLQAAHS